MNWQQACELPYYNGTDLGANYTPAATTFKLWAPTAAAVTVELFATGTDAEPNAHHLGAHHLQWERDGVWSLTLSGDWKNTYYLYHLQFHDGRTADAVDPYARTAGANGRRAMVLDLDAAAPEGWAEDKRPVIPPHARSVWEVHVADFSADEHSGVPAEYRGKFMGFVPGDTTLDGDGVHPTCLNYLKDLGVSHVQLQPIFDYETVDESRPDGSYDRIVPKFQKLVKARGGQGYYMRGTFTHHNVDFTKDLFHMADDLGFTELSMEPVVAAPDSPEALTEEDLPKLFDQYELLANDMLRRQKAGKPITFYHYILDLKHGPCIYKRISGCGSGTEYMAVTPWGDLYPCHQFVGDPAYKLGNVWDGVTNTALRDEFKLCNVYARPDCKDCWARLYCAGGCAANALHATGDIHGTYEYGCKVFRKRMECALMMQVAQRLDPELAKNAVRFESDCDGCGEGNDGACEK